MIPLFTSHYSRGRSILSLAAPDKVTDDGSDSIIKLCLDNGIKNPFLIDNNLTGLAEAVKNFSKAGLGFRFGWKALMVNDLELEERKESISKVIVFCKNTQGYYDLIRLHNAANKNHEGLMDSRMMMPFWTENLALGIPFYDSYIFNNLLYDKISQPNVKPFDPVFFKEDNGLPFDPLVAERLPKGRVLATKSIYYNKRGDFEAWQTYKCLCNIMNKGSRRSINMPMFEHCCSREFCLEAWKEAQE